MKLVLGTLVLFAAVTGATACQEKLATPTDCPDLCPGTSLIIRDTILEAQPGLDSTFVGYIPANAVGALLISNEISGGEARAFAQFKRRSDSITVDVAARPYTIDSVAFVLRLLARDTAVRNLRFILHRIPPTADTITTFDELNGELTPESIIDSTMVLDTLKTGAVRIVVSGDHLQRIAPIEADSGRLGIGIRINADSPTGVRIGSQLSLEGGPQFITYVHVDVVDTAKQHQQIVQTTDTANYVLQALPTPPPDRLFLGGRSGSRTVIRFKLPKLIKDSAAVVRATLELTPAVPIKGLRNDPGELQVRGVLIDLGAKSTPLTTVAATALLPAGATAVQSADLKDVVNLWLGPNGTTPTLLLGLSPEGGTFSRPEFFSTRSGSGAPRIHLTYALPTHPGQP